MILNVPNFPKSISFLRSQLSYCVSLLVLLASSCAPSLDTRSKILVSVKDQTMLLTQDGEPVREYAVSTSKFGEGYTRGSRKTPLGLMSVAKKIGGNAPAGAVFKSRKRTGEVIRPNAPGRDPIVTRILWLRGHQDSNKNTFGRYIYIHGTPEERRIGEKASYGCVRMRSEDIIDLYGRVGVGAEVRIIRGRLSSTAAGRAHYRAIAQKEAELNEQAKRVAVHEVEPL